MKNKIQPCCFKGLVAYFLSLIKEIVYNYIKHLIIIYNVINVKMNESCYKLRIPHLNNYC